MSLQHFLENEKHAYTIAKLAIVVQSFLTTGICTILLLSMNGIASLGDFLRVLLILDIIFICCHLTYRGTYRGRKAILSKNEKNILLWHIIISSFALVYSLVYLQSAEGDMFVRSMLAFSMWSVSLILGVLFFFKKYSKYLG